MTRLFKFSTETGGKSNEKDSLDIKIQKDENATRQKDKKCNKTAREQDNKTKGQ